MKMKNIKSNIIPTKSIYTKIVPSSTYWELLLLLCVGVVICIIIQN